MKNNQGQCQIHDVPVSYCQYCDAVIGEIVDHFEKFEMFDGGALEQEWRDEDKKEEHE